MNDKNVNRYTKPVSSFLSLCFFFLMEYIVVLRKGMLTRRKVMRWATTLWMFCLRAPKIYCRGISSFLFPHRETIEECLLFLFPFQSVCTPGVSPVKYRPVTHFVYFAHRHRCNLQDGNCYSLLAIYTLRLTSVDQSILFSTSWFRCLSISQGRPRGLLRY